MGIEAAIIGAAVVGAAGSVAGASMTNSAQAEMADKANSQAQENADTAHQREVRDLRAAGLNPILSAGVQVRRCRNIMFYPAKPFGWPLRRNAARYYELFCRSGSSSN